MNSVFSLILLWGTTSVLLVNGDGKEWWRHANIYEPYLRSFKDSDKNGIGDIKGLISKLDYLVEIGVNTIHLPPFHPSSGVDGGYDITNFYQVDPVYGEMQPMQDDFYHLTEALKEKNIYLLMDLVINSTSSKHEWFENSKLRKKVNGIDYTDWFIWADPKGIDKDGKPIPPNNWFKLLDYHLPGSAWTYVEERKQFYYHAFMEEQPDLNLRNAAVKEEIKKIITFWLDKGVSGFILGAPMLFMEDPQLRDNPEVKKDTPTMMIYDALPQTANHPDTFPFIAELNRFIRQYDREHGRADTPTPMIGEIWGSVENQMKYFDAPDGHPMIEMPINYIISALREYLNAGKLIALLRTWTDKLPEGKASNWALGNHDSLGRIAHWFNEEYNYILLALVSMLPGASTVYYGEELGMLINKAFPANTDPTNRPWVRTPMQWDDSKNAGFTSAERPWTPAHPNYWRVNVSAQKKEKNSLLHYFTKLMQLRQTDAGKYGDLKYHTLSEWVMAFSRTHEDTKTSYIVLLNVGSYFETIDLRNEIVKSDEESLNVLISSPNSLYEKGQAIKSSEYPLQLRPHSVIIFQHLRNGERPIAGDIPIE
ncbi:maltase 1-like [Planococcus citri]|uniref:maltase 1-like n=1 Tax=Planococcus citri TaxID=170843 RepID=UPI0031F8A469